MNNEKDISLHVYENNVEKVKEYLLTHEDPSNSSFLLSDTEGYDFATILPRENLKLIHIAAFGDALDVFQLLENHGFSINDTTLDNYLPLHYACSKGSYKVASYILSKDPLMIQNEPKNVKYNLLYISAYNYNILELLFENNVNIESYKEGKEGPLEKAISSNSLECSKILYSHGIKLHDPELTIPMYACMNIHPEIVEYFLSIETKPINYCSPTKHNSILGLCCFYGKIYKNTILKILQNAEDIEPPIPNCDGPVHWICTMLDVDIAKAFLLHNIDVNRIDENNKTGFHLMSDKIHKEKEVIEIMKLLINAGFDVNLQLPCSVLEEFCTSIKKSYKMIEFLIENGADIYVKDKDGNRLYDIVMSRRDTKLKSLFQKSSFYIPE